jgi:predicted ATPase
MVQSLTSRLPIRLQFTPRYSLACSWGLCFFVSAMPTKHLPSPTQLLLARGSWRTRRFSLRALVMGTRLLSLAGYNRALDEQADEVVSLAVEQGFSVLRLLGTILRGWVKVKNGDVTEGMSLLRSGSAAYRATGAKAWMPYYIALLAAVCEIAGEIQEALALVDEALQLAARTGVRWFAAELYRQKGPLLLRQEHAEAAEELYRKALRIAREQEAKLWELRAAVSLARLRCDQGRPAEACEILAPVYGWLPRASIHPI